MSLMGEVVFKPLGPFFFFGKINNFPVARFSIGSEIACAASHSKMEALEIFLRITRSSSHEDPSCWVDIENLLRIYQLFFETGAVSSRIVKVIDKALMPVVSFSMSATMFGGRQLPEEVGSLLSQADDAADQFSNITWKTYLGRSRFNNVCCEPSKLAEGGFRTHFSTCFPLLFSISSCLSPLYIDPESWGQHHSVLLPERAMS
jgi:hypothetical protein